MYTHAIELAVGLNQLFSSQPTVTNKVAQFASRYWPLLLLVSAPVVLGAALYTLDPKNASD